MSVGARVDQLRVHPHVIAGPLNASFHYMRHTELPADLAQIARDPAFVLHHTCAADYSQIGDFRQIAQDFVLHAIGKKGVLLVVTEVLKREYGNSICCWPTE
jgi:hypothetical protein